MAFLIIFYMSIGHSMGFIFDSYYEMGNYLKMLMICLSFVFFEETLRTNPHVDKNILYAYVLSIFINVIYLTLIQNRFLTAVENEGEATGGQSLAKCLGAKRKIKDVGDGDMYNPWWDVLASGTGTLMYNGAWNLFDQIILSPSLLDRDGKKDYSSLKLFSHQIFRRDYLFQKEGKYKGNTLRTHAGGVWLNGYSDHLPTVVYLIKEQK